LLHAVEPIVSNLISRKILGAVVDCAWLVITRVSEWWAHLFMSIVCVYINIHEDIYIYICVCVVDDVDVALFVDLLAVCSAGVFSDWLFHVASV